MSINKIPEEFDKAFYDWAYKHEQGHSHVGHISRMNRYKEAWSACLVYTGKKIEEQKLEIDRLKGVEFILKQRKCGELTQYICENFHVRPGNDCHESAIVLIKELQDTLITTLDKFVDSEGTRSAELYAYEVCHKFKIDPKQVPALQP